MRILEFSGGVMAFNESGTAPTSLPDFSSIGIPAEAVKEEGEGLLHAVDCKNDNTKSKLGKIDMVVKNKYIKGGGTDIRVRRLDRPMHYQVLKIKEEDSHLGEDIGEGLTSKDKLAFVHHATAHILWPRSVLPSSRLGANKTINQIKAGLSFER